MAQSQKVVYRDPYVNDILGFVPSTLNPLYHSFGFLQITTHTYQSRPVRVLNVACRLCSKARARKNAAPGLSPAPVNDLCYCKRWGVRSGDFIGPLYRPPNRQERIEQVKSLSKGIGHRATIYWGTTILIFRDSWAALLCRLRLGLRHCFAQTGW